ncbi:MAG: PQQ-binding-like beta-propeller repeat protein [Planctomycetota bacterium]
MKRLFPVLVSVLCLLPLVASAEVASWPEFRGPTGDGKAAGNIPLVIDDSVVKWKVDIHGKGWSSPVVWDDQIWLTTATEDGKQMFVVCVDRQSGKIVHDKLLISSEEPDFCHPMNSYATPTPVIENGRVYVHFGSYGTFCLNTKTADTIWKRDDLPCNHHRGPASSPILHEGNLFVAYDGFDQQYVVALDKQNGTTIWKQKRDIDYGTDNGDLKKAYCTASIINVNGQQQLVYPSAIATIAYNPNNGDSLWRVYHKGMNASARPLYASGLVFITNGMGSMVAVDPNGSGDLTSTQIAWSSRKGVAKKSSQLAIDGLLYMISDDGIASCRDCKSGKVIWLERLKGSFAASPIYASGRIYLFDRDGKITVIKPGRKFELLSQSKLGDGFMASPAVVENEVILRSKTRLYCVAQ